MSGFFSSVQCARAATLASDSDVALNADHAPSVQAERGSMTQRTHPLCATYWGMRDRCLSPKSTNYRHYGGRGISVCRRWLGRDGFWNFIADMGPRPSGHTLDRINVNGNYEPANCRWATVAQQNRNKRNSRRAVFDGATCSVAEKAVGASVSLAAVRKRLARGVPAELSVLMKRRGGFRWKPASSLDPEFAVRLVALVQAGLSYRHIAKSLEMPHGTIASSIRRARAAGLLPAAQVSRAKAGPGPRPRRSG